MSKFLPINLFIRQALLYPLTFPFLPPIDKVEKDHKYAAGRLIGTLEAPPPQGLPKTAQTTKYRNGDDGDYEAGYPYVGARYTDNGDGTITDNGTGLMWVKDPINDLSALFDGYTDWDEAIDACEALSFATHDDWRLPNIKELLSIVDYKIAYPVIDPLFTNCPPSIFWSSTTYRTITSRAWDVHFWYGTCVYTPKSLDRYARPVRLGLAPA